MEKAPNYRSSSSCQNCWKNKTNDLDNIQCPYINRVNCHPQFTICDDWEEDK
jgi:hypothetical protein